MKIVDAKVIVTSPGRNFVTLKIITDEGVYGIGDATLNGRELAVAAYLQVGATKHLWINIVLSLLFYFPGVIHALWLVLTDQKA